MVQGAHMGQGARAWSNALTTGGESLGGACKLATNRYSGSSMLVDPQVGKTTIHRKL